MDVPERAIAIIEVEVPGARLAIDLLERADKLQLPVHVRSAHSDVLVIARWPFTADRVAGWQNPILRERFFPHRLTMLRRFLYIDALSTEAESLLGGTSAEALEDVEKRIVAEQERLTKLKQEGKVLSRDLLYEGVHLHTKKLGKQILEAKKEINKTRTKERALPLLELFQRDMYDAVCQFQIDRNVKLKEEKGVLLKVDGMVGARTWFELLIPPGHPERARWLDALKEAESLTVRLHKIGEPSPTASRGSRAVLASRYLANCQLEIWQKESHAEILERIGRAFKRDEQQSSKGGSRKYPPWVQYIVLHASGMIYKNDHVTLYDHTALVKALRCEPTEHVPNSGRRGPPLPPRVKTPIKSALEREVEACSDEELAAWARELLALRSDSSTKHSREEAALRSMVSGATTSVPSRAALGKAVLSLEKAVFARGLASAKLETLLEHLVSRKPKTGSNPAPGTGCFGPATWRRVVYHTALRAHFVKAASDAPNVVWNKKGTSCTIEPLPRPEKEWAEVIWEPARGTMWRPFTRQTLWPALVHAVCNELSEMAQYARGAAHPGGLRENANAVARAGDGLRTGRSAGDAAPGDCMFWVGWREKKEILDRSNVFPAIETIFDQVSRAGGRMRQGMIDPPKPPGGTVTLLQVPVPLARTWRAKAHSRPGYIHMEELQPDWDKDKSALTLTPKVTMTTEITVRRYDLENPLGDEPSRREVAKMVAGPDKTRDLYACWSHEAVVLFRDSHHKHLVVLDTRHPVGVNTRPLEDYQEAHSGHINGRDRSEELAPFLALPSLLGGEGSELRTFLASDRRDPTEEENYKGPAPHGVLPGE